MNMRVRVAKARTEADRQGMSCRWEQLCAVVRWQEKIDLLAGKGEASGNQDVVAVAGEQQLGESELADEEIDQVYYSV